MVGLAISSKVFFWRLLVVRFLEVQTRWCIHGQQAGGGETARGTQGTPGTDSLLVEQCVRNRKLIERSCRRVWRVPRSCLFIVMFSVLLFGCIVAMDVAGDAVGFERSVKFPAALLVMGAVGRLTVTAMKYRNYLQGESAMPS